MIKVFMRYKGIMYAGSILIIIVNILMVVGGIGYYDPVRAVESAVENAENKSHSLCAKYVREALQDAGIRVIVKPSSAYLYNDFLPILGYSAVEMPYKPGDVVVFMPTGNRKYGHIAIYTGEGWVSDFKQKSFYVHSDYLKSKDYIVYRKEKGRFYNNLYKQLPFAFK